MADSNEVTRPLANYPPDIWGDRFLSLPFNNSEFEFYSKQVEESKEMVKDMLVVSTRDPIEKIYLINSLYRLGVSYHFENEIEEQLSHLFIGFPKLLDENNFDLHIVAVTFQVFRVHGYKLSCDVFIKFLDDRDGKFKEELVSNTKGMLSLYEACHFKLKGEDILDEALAFTTKHLGSLANQSSPHLKEHIENALFRPYHHGMPRLEARQYIFFYEKDDSMNDILLKFAKYDFNRVQMLHQQELSAILSWYKELNFKAKLPYVRHRPVEGFFYALCIYFEPRYAFVRKIIVKFACILIGFIDDTYDSYGLYEELQRFTDAIQRFDISGMDVLYEENQKFLYENILSIHDELENELRQEGRSYKVSYAKDEFMKFVLAELVETRWRHEGIVPTFEEYLENGLYTCTIPLTMSHIMMGIEAADQNAYEWVLNSHNKFLRALQTSYRLYNDIATNEEEEKRGLTCTATVCYMKQYKVSRKEATKAFRTILASTWDDINESCMRPTPVPMQVLRVVVNAQRSLDVTYRDNDEYTKAHISLRDIISKLLMHAIPI